VRAAPSPLRSTVERAAGPRLRLRHPRRGRVAATGTGDAAAARPVVFRTHACRALADARAPVRQVLGRCHRRA